MFCRKCGKTLLDGDRFCSYCGAQVIERNEHINLEESVEEVIYNNDESAFEVPDGEKNAMGVQHKTLAQTWHEINGKSQDKPPKPHWNLEGFPVAGEEPRKTEDINVDWDKRQVLRFDTMQEKKQDTPKAIVDNLKEEQVILEEKKPDIFELFDKQMKDEKETEKNSKDTLIFQREPETTLEQELFKPRNNDKIHTPAEEQIDKFYTFSKKNEEFQKLLDKEYERLKKTPEFICCEPKIPSNIEKLEINMPSEQTLNSNIIPPIEKTEEKIEEEIEVSQEQFESKDNKVEGILPKNSLEKNEECTEKNPEELPKNSLDKEFNEQKTEETPVLPWDEMESPLSEFTDEDAGKKISSLAVLLTVIIALLVFEVAILGIKYFLPESSAAAFINDKLGGAVNWVEMMKSDDKKQEEQKEAEVEKSKADEAQEVNAAVQPDPVPNPDKAELIAEALVYNTNIKSISADESLAYAENMDYGDKNINNSKPIENNIWYEDENGNTVYYDKELVKTIIQFDSAWIDYVNKKDNTVLGFTKEGSSAYTKTKNFLNAGKITENFDSLKIGEIRQGGNGFYIWVYETITINENGKAKIVNYNYIYYLEPVAKQMKIVSYKKL